MSLAPEKHQKTRAGSNSYILPCIFTLILYLLNTSAFAGSALDKMIYIDIPADASLEDALINWGTKTGMTVMVNTRAVEGKTTPKLKGTLNAGKVLQMLLNNSGLSYTANGDRIQIVQDGSLARSVWRSESSTPDSNTDTAEAPALSETSVERGAQIPEVLVTAQKREENIEKVPISITALSQQTMDDLRIENVSDLATVVPGLTLSPSSPFQDNSNISIRGIDSGGANAPTTQLYIDETPIAIRQLSSAYSKSPFPNIFDLDRVEVLRGPQGTLFGASAMGGAIRFITPQPNLTDRSGVVKADLGYTDGGEPNYEVGAAYGSPIVTGALGFRVSAWYQSLGGFIDQEDPYTGAMRLRNANRSNAYVIRPAFSWAPSEALTITAAAFLQHQYSQNSNSYWVNNIPVPEAGRSHVWGGTLQPMVDDLRVGSLTIKYNFAGLSLVSDTSYLDRQSDTVEDVTQFFDYVLAGAPIIPSLQSFVHSIENISFTHAVQQEFRLSSDVSSSKINWVIGAFYRSAVQGLKQLEKPDLSPLFEYAYGLNSLELTGVPDYIYNGQVLNSFSDFHTTDVSEALFGDISIQLLPRLKLDMGARVEHVIVKDQREFLAGPLNFLGVESALFFSPDAVENPVTPRASVTYQMTDEAMLYASAAKGYRPGGGNNASINTNSSCQPSLNAQGLTSAPLTFSPDSLWSYELGIKAQPFDRRFSIDGSIYYTRWNNIQSQVAVASCAYNFTINQGEVISRGFDLQVAAALSRDLKFGGQIGYTDAYYAETRYGAPINGVQPILFLAGDKLLSTLPWTAAANGEYSHDVEWLSPGTRSYIRLDYRWLGPAAKADPRVAGYDPTIAPFTDPAYNILNVRFGIRHDGMDVSAYVDNATRANPRLGYSNLLAGDPLITASSVRPLTVGLTFWYRF